MTIYSAVRSLALNFAVGVNRHCFSIVLSQYEGFNDVEIDRLGGAVIQLFYSEFTHRCAIACHGIHYPIGIVLWPTGHEFFNVKARFQLWRHRSQKMSRFKQRGLASKLYVYHSVSVKILSSLLQPVEITVQMNSRPSRDFCTLTSFVCRRFGIFFSAIYRHEAHTTSLLANIMFVTSLPGVARNLYSCCGSEIIFMLVL